jgi:hypothetical protein
LLKDLTKEDAKALQERLDNKAISHTSLALVLKKNNYEVSASTLGRHRRKLCTGDSSK